MPTECKRRMKKLFEIWHPWRYMGFRVSLMNQLWTKVDGIYYRYESWEITFIENVQTKNGSVALLWWNAKCNVNPLLSYFERCTLAYLHLHFVFRQSKAMLQIYYKSRLYYRYDVEEYFQNDLCHYEYSNELSFWAVP